MKPTAGAEWSSTPSSTLPEANVLDDELLDTTVLIIEHSRC